jgi:hypothetical protein
MKYNRVLGEKYDTSRGMRAIRSYGYTQLMAIHEAVNNTDGARGVVPSNVIPSRSDFVRKGFHVIEHQLRFETTGIDGIDVIVWRQRIEHDWLDTDSNQKPALPILPNDRTRTGNIIEKRRGKERGHVSGRTTGSAEKYDTEQDSKAMAHGWPPFSRPS